VSLLPVLRRQAPDSVALSSAGAVLTREALCRRVASLAASLVEQGVSCVALLADNGIDWVVADLACLEARVRIVPVPLFFTQAQVRHLLVTSGADTLLADRNVAAQVPAARPVPGWTSLPGLRRFALATAADVQLPDPTWKITYTSGTTGAPKGVCLSARHLLGVARSLDRAIGLVAPNHLAILPLSTLLENVAGIYAPLLAGGSVSVPPLADVGLSGSSRLDVERLLSCITLYEPQSLILVPEILRVLTAAAECGWRVPRSLRFVAVGGSKTAPALVERGRQAGLPVYEGYGLSECGSVTTLNLPGSDRPGSAGRPLPHAGVTIDGGEICLSGTAMLGYVGQPDSWHPREIRSGDLGFIDEDGFVHIEGRARNLIITSYGRNVSPEWVESELLAGPHLAQAVVTGDARPYCTALLRAADESASDAAIEQLIRAANRRLPDYARVLDWRRLPEPLSADAGLLTGNGRPLRAAIETRCRSLIDAMYDEQPEAINQ